LNKQQKLNFSPSQLSSDLCHPEVPRISCVGISAET
jgi:hypothetical protein